ncbi:MAG TPA: protein translocase subunit SecF [Thermodesulfobacteriota bacterium]|nr:protein translocase subunit SecF [Thermodesulfobacteriota bacterium]
MEFFRVKTNIDFIGKRNYAFVFSSILILITIISLIFHKGPRYGVDFAGGISVRVKFSQPVTAAAIKSGIQTLNLSNCTVQEFIEKGQHEFQIQSSTENLDIENIQASLTQALSKKFGEGRFEVRKIETVGPKVGKDLREKGLWAVVISWVMMLIYVAFRFKHFSFGLGGIVALAHDVLVTVGAFSITNREIDLTIVAALLTIIGFSINDTIVIYDRVRENRRKTPGVSLPELINRSINETLSRTIITTGTVLLGVVALFLFGGGVIHNFAFAMLVGCISGTYSTLYIASPVVIVWEEKFKGKKKRRY